jgi:Tol biopolymer transport system component
MTRTLLLVAFFSTATHAQEPAKNPADHLPPHITRLTFFGERADFSHDGKRILFVEKTAGDVYEIELSTKVVRPVTHHYPHEGYTRALYLANGDILLSGAKSFDAENAGRARSHDPELWILDKSRTRPPTRLGEKCSEGPAVSRRNMRFAWTITPNQYPDRLKKGQSQIWTADVEYADGRPSLVNRKLALDSTMLPFQCTLECQNFRPPAEEELTFSSYGHAGTEVMSINLSTGRITNYSNAPKQYDEPEGVFPDGMHTLVECDQHNLKGWQHTDIYRLRLDGSGELTRLTHFNDYTGFKASNPVVSDNGRWMAFQLAKTTESAGVGHGIFLYELSAAGQ